MGEDRTTFGQSVDMWRANEISTGIAKEVMAMLVIEYNENVGSCGHPLFLLCVTSALRILARVAKYFSKAFFAH